MEDRDTLKPNAEALLAPFCREMSEAIAELLRRLSPSVTQRDVDELPLLTLGSQFHGGWSNKIGKAATEDVFRAVKEIAEEHVTKEAENRLVVLNSAGRPVRITLAADPDISIEEEFEDELRAKVAIEIKGGTDKSNAHNRAGEAEKSHQKAKRRDFRDYWTVIATTGLDLNVLKSESPTTNSWFDVAQVLAREGKDWVNFRSRIADALGIPV
jgi:hypothetical protein